MESTVLECRQLSFARPGGVILLDRIDAEFGPQGPVLVTGATGAGKSTLLHLLGAMLRPMAGEVRADGQPVSRWSAVHKDVWRRNLGMVFQELHLVNDLTVLENILLPCIPRNSGWEKAARRAAALLARFGLPEEGRLRPGLLSGGQRQRVAWARALVANPRFLLLDEPTAFQDDDSTRTLLEVLAETAEKGCCVVVCSHDERLRRARNLFACVRRLAQGRLEDVP
jgi:putative ABC transport system ATP-binding protein